MPLHSSYTGADLHVNAPISAADLPARPQVTVTANTTLNSTHDRVFCDTDAAAGAIVITLPTAVGIDGKEYTIKNTGTMAGANANVTFVTASSQTIDRASAGSWNIVPEGSGGQNVLVLVSDGANWQIVADYTSF